MNRPRSAMARALLGRFADADRRTRAHVRLRWLTCPFPAVEPHLPRRGLIADIGCGHGLFSLLLAATGPDRVVVGHDIDGAKLRAARRAAAAPPSLANVGFSDEGPPDGPLDGVAVIDVLYLLDPEAQAALVRRLARSLAPGGALVVKETGPTPRWKGRLLALQEQLSVRALQITRASTDRFCFTAPSTVAAWLEDEGLAVETHDLGRGYHVPHHLLIARAPGSARS